MLQASTVEARAVFRARCRLPPPATGPRTARSRSLKELPENAYRSLFAPAAIRASRWGVIDEPSKAELLRRPGVFFSKVVMAESARAALMPRITADDAGCNESAAPAKGGMADTL